MNILLTGGTGFIGQKLIQLLMQDSSKEHVVTVLTRDKQRATSLLKKTLSSLNQKSIQFIGSLNELDNLNQFDAVINLAGEPISQYWSKKNKAKISHSRFNITQKLVDLIKQSDCPPACFISGSAVGIYGDQQDNIITDDFVFLGATSKNNTDLTQQFTYTICNQWESIAKQAQSDKTRVCLLRTGIVLGQQGGVLKALTPLFKLGLGGKIGNGKQYMPWIHIDDMARAILFLLENSKAHGSVNLAAPHASTNQQFGKTLAKTLRRPFFCHTPAWVMRTLLGEVSALVLDSANVKPTKLNELGFEFNYCSLDNALTQIYLTRAS